MSLAALRALLGDRRTPLLAVLPVPWTVVLSDGAVSLVFAWGLASASPPPLHVVTLSQYLLSFTAGLPGYLQAWPLSVLLYACALVTAVGSWADDRATVALLATAGATSLWVSVGIWRTGRPALPVGTALLWSVAAFWQWTGRGPA